MMRSNYNGRSVEPHEEEYFSKKLGYNPWAAQRKLNDKKRGKDEVESLLEAKMIDKKQRDSAMDADDPFDAISRDPKFLDKVFKK